MAIHLHLHLNKHHKSICSVVEPELMRDFMKKSLFLDTRGFTLIELIAVMVILGILMSIALPRYFDMQSSARQNAVNGALAALQANAAQEYAKGLLINPTSTSYSPTSPVTIGDFTGKIELGVDNAVIITVTNGPDWWNPSIENSKSFRLY